MASMVPYSLSCQTDFTVPAPQRRSSPNALVISSCCTSSAVFSLAAYYPSASVLTGKLPGIIASILLAIQLNFYQPGSSLTTQMLLT